MTSYFLLGWQQPLFVVFDVRQPKQVGVRSLGRSVAQALWDLPWNLEQNIEDDDLSPCHRNANHNYPKKLLSHLLRLYLELFFGGLSLFTPSQRLFGALGYHNHWPNALPHVATTTHLIWLLEACQWDWFWGATVLYFQWKPFKFSLPIPMAMKGAPKASYQGSLETNDINLLGETWCSHDTWWSLQ